MDLEDKPETNEPPKRKACVPCKIMGLIVFGLAGYGLYSLIETFVLAG